MRFGGDNVAVIYNYQRSLDWDCAGSSVDRRDERAKIGWKMNTRFAEKGIYSVDDNQPSYFNQSHYS